MKTTRGLAAVRLAVAVCTAVLASSAVASAQPTIQTVHVFEVFGPATEGSTPRAPLVQATDGNFYGVTQTDGPLSMGTVFKMTPAGVVTVLHAFSGLTDGANPTGGLLQAADGNFYGTTGSGGAFNLGAVFRMTPAGTLTLLHSFTAGPADGAVPLAALIQAADGNFYGTTQTGGASGLGTVFRMASSGSVTVLHAFAGATDGAYPSVSLMQASNGKFLGTAPQGGPSGYGTFFSVTPAGVFAVLHAFSAGSGDGSSPSSPLIEASDGNVYGTTMSGGSLGFGAIFKMTPAGTVSLHYSFAGQPDGANPFGAIVQAADGDIYGTTVSGGANNFGAIFKMGPGGSVTFPDSFQLNTWSVAPTPISGLIQATDGNLYGTTIAVPSSGNTVFRLASSAPAVITSPRPGAVLRSTMVQFSWDAVPDATEYWLEVGTAIGQHDVYGQSIGSATARIVFPLPIYTETLYVRLWTRLSGGWQFNDYTYTADGRVAMTSPTPGSTLSGATVTFSWNAGAGATQVWLDVGTSPGQGNLFGQSVGLAASQTVSGLPLLGQAVYVRLWTRFSNGSWYFNDYTYTAANAKAVMISPAPGSTLTGPSVTFNWIAYAGATQYWLDVGTAPGKSDLFGQSAGLAASQLVSGLPVTGAPIAVRLWTQVGGSWLFNDYIYFAFNAKAVMTSPASGSTLSGSSVTFNWNAGTGATEYWLDVGTSPGASNFFGQSVGVTTSQTVNGLPIDGSLIFVRLWTKLNGSWVFNNYVYLALNAKAVMTSPAPGSTFNGSSVTFSWTAGIGASAYWLEVQPLSAGTVTPYFSQGVGLATSQTVTGLPVNGAFLSVTLWTQVNGGWLSSSYSYTAFSAQAVMTSPAQGSTLTGANVTFTWSAGTGATGYWLDIGSDLFHSNDLFSQDAGLATSLPVSGIPTTGKPIYVVLWTEVNGVWLSNHYNYTTFNGKAMLTTPAPGPSLTQSSVQFGWNAVTGASEYWLEVGTTLGSGDIFTHSTGTSTSQTVTGIPTGADAVHVRLWTLFSGVWQYTDSMYGGHLITFGGVGSNGSPVTTYNESTFSVNATSGPWVAITTYGNPAPFVWFQSPAGTTTTAELTIVPTGRSVPFQFHRSLLQHDHHPV